MEPAVTVGRKSGETTQTLNLRGDRMSRPDLQSSARRPVMVFYIRSCRGGAGHCGAVLSCSALLSFSGVTSLFLLLLPLLMVQHMTCIQHSGPQLSFQLQLDLLNHNLQRRSSSDGTRETSLMKCKFIFLKKKEEEKKSLASLSSDLDVGSLLKQQVERLKAPLQSNNVFPVV